MFRRFRRWRRQQRLENLDTTAGIGAQAWQALPQLRGLDEGQARRLREQAALFVAEKSFEPVAGFAPPPGAERTIALLACLPVLELDLEWLDDFTTVVLYPGSFVAEFDDHDEATGVVHRVREERSGESWDIGPLVLSWTDVAESAALDGYNVVLHEIAHKLDARDGVLNGKPPLHTGMIVSDWSSAFLDAYQDHVDAVEHGVETALDPYGAEAPEEFFAVATETFFELTTELHSAYPAVYEQLRRFFRQDPAERLSLPAAGGA